MTNSSAPKFLIIDGYTQAAREELQAGGASVAADLYVSLLLKNAPEETVCDVIFPADPGVVVGVASSGDDRGEGSGGLCLRARGGEISSSPSLSTTAMRRAVVSSSSSMSSPMLSSRSKLASA